MAETDGYWGEGYYGEGYYGEGYWGTGYAAAATQEAGVYIGLAITHPPIPNALLRRVKNWLLTERME